jgi:hypothetical protein
LVLRLYQETVHDFILLFMPPCSPHLTPLATGSLERSLLVFSTPGGLTGGDLSRLFFTAPTPVKPQPAPAILSRESVHATLSITHHTWKRPSTGPRTTHDPQSPLDECIDNTHTKVTREKRKRKETKKKKLQQAIERQTRAKSKIT